MLKASILIPTKNGGEYLEECLNAVFNQKAVFAFEVIIVDSGSKDGTLEIIKKFPQIKLFQIPPLEFGHGRTRNLAVSKSSGEFLVFLTQDAIPVDENWLAKIVEPMEKDEQVAGVFGRHLPHKNCDPFQRKMLNDFMESLKKNLICQLIGENSEAEFEKRKNEYSFFSNVNSAIRRSVWEKISFQNVEMGEDQFWAKDILLAGYKKAYAYDAKVYHSHNYGIRNQFKRWFDEFCQHKKNLNYVGVSSFWKIIPLALRLWFNDVKYIYKQKEYNFLQKIYWSIWIFFMDLARFCAEYLGARYAKLPKWAQKKLSMQHELIYKN